MVAFRWNALALSFLTCGCGVRGVPAGDGSAAARQYVIEHRAQLEQEIQQGSGEGLYELSRIADCRNLSELNRKLRKRHAEIFPVPAPSDPQVADHIVALLQDSALVCRDLERGPKGPFRAGRRHVFGSDVPVRGGA